MSPFKVAFRHVLCRLWAHFLIIEYIKYSIDLEKFEESEERIIIFNTTWKNLREVWGIFVHHDDILEIESSIAEIEACIENNDKDDVKIRIDRLISNITAVAEREKINIEILNMNEENVYKILQKKNLDLKNILLGTIDERNNFIYQLKEEE